MGIWCQNDDVSTSIRRDHVASTLIRRHFYVMCPLGYSFIQGVGWGGGGKDQYWLLLIFMWLLDMVRFWATEQDKNT